MTPEAKVKQDIRAALDTIAKAEKSWYYMPVASRYSVAGIPDFIGCTAGRMWAIEAKAAKGRTTALQDRTLEAMSTAGVRTGIVKPGDTSIYEQVARIVLGG